MNFTVDYQPSMWSDVVYYILLYSALLCTGLPVIYVSLWKFLGFWRKHKVLFYLFFVMILGGTFAAYYLTCNYWLLWYSAFPTTVQVVGLILFSLSFILIRISHHHLDTGTVLFYSVLNRKHGVLMTKGVYKLIRHPVYSLVPVLILGAFLYTGQYALIYPFAANFLLRWYYAGLEERYLNEIYGEEFKEYMKKTPFRFYPLPVSEGGKSR